MAHVSTEEYWDIEGSFEDPSHRTWNRKFKVIFDDIVYQFEALNAPDLPVPWDGHPADSTMRAGKAKAVHWEGDPYVWMVDIEYSSATGDSERGDPDPRNRPLEIETDFTSFQTPLIYDKNGQAVLNSAKDPFDPPWQKEDSRPILRFSRYESSLDLARSLEYRNAVNTDSFYGFAAGELMCMHIKQKRHFENGFEVWHTSYEFQGKANGTVQSYNSTLNFQGWDAVIPDLGFNELKTFGGGVVKSIACKDGYGKDVTSPVRLNGSGVAQIASNPLSWTAFKVFSPSYPYLPFANLGLI